MSYFRPEIQKMSGYVPGEQPAAGKFIKLNTNENPYPASPAVGRAIEATMRRGLERYPDPMADAFRTRAAELLGAQLMGIGRDWILCGNGSDDLLTIVTRGLVGQGDLLRMPYPSYVLYETLAQIQGAEIEEVHFEKDWSLSDKFSARADRLRLAFLANPNSPSGTVIRPRRVLELADKLPCPLLVDEAYADFAEENCLRLVAQNEKIMVSRSLSKSYSLAGLRFGYLVAQPQIIAQLAKVKDSYNCDSISIAAATAALDDQTWLAENRNKILATRTRLAEELGQLGFDVAPSQANFLWATHPERPLQPVFEQLKAKKILVRYMDYPHWSDGLRISVGTDEQIDALLATLKSIVG